MLQYIHDVNAKVTEGNRYLTDVVQLKMEKVHVDAVLDTDGVTVLEPAYDYYHVTAYPAVETGTETITTVPVHPKTVGETKVVPTYGVPTELKMLVRATPDQLESTTAGYNTNNWREQTVTVLPIADVQFDSDKESDALAFYEQLYHQLAEGDDIRHFYRKDVVGSRYDFDNSRYQ